MSDEKNDDASFGEFWLLENQYLDEIDNEPDLEIQFQEQKELTYQKLWHLFQGAATCVAHLHKGSHSFVDRGARWTPFQTAAGSVTALYKESVDGVRRCAELALLRGRQKRTRELAAWLRRRRTVRRDELLAFLAGRPGSPHSLRHAHAHRSQRSSSLLHRHNHHHHHHHHQSSTPASQQSAAPSVRRVVQTHGAGTVAAAGAVAAGALTRDVFMLNSLQGAMSSVSVQPADMTSASRLMRSPSRRHSSSAAAAVLPDSALGVSDPHVHVKRSVSPASPSDVIMHSPVHKRTRFS